MLFLRVPYCNYTIRRIKTIFKLFGPVYRGYRGLSNYLYYFGGSLLLLKYNGPQNPILIIKAPILPDRDLRAKVLLE